MKLSFSAIPRYFLIFFVVFSGTIFFAALESFRNYRAEAELLILSRSASLPSETAAKTFAALPGTLSFYDRLLSEHDGIEDPWSNLSRIERKDRWSRVVETEVLPGTNLLRFSVLAKTPEQATALLGASLETFYGFAGRLYHRDTEADIRLIEHSGTRPTLHSVGALISISTLLGGALAFLVSTLFRSSFRPFSMRSFPLKNVPEFSEQSSSSEKIRPIGNFSSQTEKVVFPDSGDSTDRSIENDKKEVSLPASPESSPIKPPSEASAFESVAPWHTDVATESAIENVSSRISDEPEDIWERPRAISKQVAGEGTRSRIGNAIQPSTEKRSLTPGNLETIPADDFKWENVLAPTTQDTVPEAPLEVSTPKGETETVSPPSRTESTAPERREPTPEELKARLNELLRGDL